MATQRVLACVLCQRRKAKCDRKDPCGNCVKACERCVPAMLNSRPRRRRFPERELLDRLRYYENLLRQNAIEFEPLHVDRLSPSESVTAQDLPGKQSEAVETIRDRLNTETPALCQEATKSETVYETQSIYLAR